MLKIPIRWFALLAFSFALILLLFVSAFVLTGPVHFDIIGGGGPDPIHPVASVILFIVSFLLIARYILLILKNKLVLNIHLLFTDVLLLTLIPYSLVFHDTFDFFTDVTFAFIATLCFVFLPLALQFLVLINIWLHRHDRLIEMDYTKYHLIAIIVLLVWLPVLDSITSSNSYILPRVYSASLPTFGFDILFLTLSLLLTNLLLKDSIKYISTISYAATLALFVFYTSYLFNLYLDFSDTSASTQTLENTSLLFNGVIVGSLTIFGVIIHATQQSKIFSVIPWKASLLTMIMFYIFEKIFDPLVTALMLLSNSN